MNQKQKHRILDGIILLMFLFGISSIVVTEYRRRREPAFRGPHQVLEWATNGAGTNILTHYVGTIRVEGYTNQSESFLVYGPHERPHEHDTNCVGPFTCAWDNGTVFSNCWLCPVWGQGFSFTNEP